MKKAVVLVSSLFLMLAFVPCVKPACAAGGPIGLKFAEAYNIYYTLHKDVFVPWAEELEKRTNGRVKVTFYPSEAMGKAKDHYDLAARGIAQLTDTNLAYTPGRFPLSTVLDLPLGIPSAKVGSQVAWELFTKYLNKEYPGVKVLAFKTTAQAHIYTTRKPVRTLEDLKGMRLRAADAWLTAAVKALGASPLNIPGPDAADALQKGMADGVTLSDSGVTGFGLEDLVRYRTTANLYVIPTITIMNQKTWDSLPADIQKIVESMSGQVLAERAGIATDKDADACLEVQKKKGVQLIQISPEERKRWDEKMKPIDDAWAAEMESKGLPGKKILEETLALVQKYSK